jgi:hypothetical protein
LTVFFLLLLHERVLGGIADRTGPVIGKLRELLAFLRLIVDISAHGTPPHSSLLRPLNGI